MTCDNCVCHLDEMGICQHARARLQKRESKKIATKELDKIESTTLVSTHTLTDEEFEKLVKDAHKRFKPTMERLK